MEHVKRNPDGLVKKQPIALRLMPDELANAKRVSEETNTSLSYLAREAFLKGLPLVISNFSTAAAHQTPSRAADFSGGEASASPAGLSLTAAAA